MGLKLTLYACESVNIGFSLKSYSKVTLHGLESMFFGFFSNSLVDKENMSPNRIWISANLLKCVLNI